MAERRRRVLVTGANRGIGLGFVRSFLDSGDEVISTVRNQGILEEMEDLGASHGGRLRTVVVDLVSPEAEHQIDSLARSLDSLDVLVNNAGYYPEAEGERFSPDDLAEWRKGFEINVFGPAKLLYRMIPLLDRSERPKIANLSSQMGSIGDNGSGGSYGYRMSKCALNMLTKNLALDYPEIVALALHPGWVRTRMGGPEARISVEEAVQGLRRVIDEAGSAESGRFFNSQGEELPW